MYKLRLFLCDIKASCNDKASIALKCKKKCISSRCHIKEGTKICHLNSDLVKREEDNNITFEEEDFCVKVFTRGKSLLELWVTTFLPD